MRSVPPDRRNCAGCDHFRNDPAYLEATVPGLASFGSGWASVRADDGLCLRHGRHAGARGCCAAFAPFKGAAESSR